ncbi:MAG: threonine synthase [Acidobacteria bacterium]|nr:threonine synthase [Acidobacteriota bacterium]
MLPERSLASALVCSRTGTTASLDDPQFLSPTGAPWLVDYDLSEVDGSELAARWRQRPWSMWRYRELLPHRRDEDRVDLGEGGTPLIRLRRTVPREIEVLLKEESGNPTGSFKARGLAMAVHRARELGAPGVELASAGNAGLALAAYAAAHGLPARVALPEDAPAKIIARCRYHGASVLTAGGTLLEAARRLADFDDGYWNISTLKEPYRVEGKKTMGLELAEQLGWGLPDWIFYPTGGGTGIVGMQRAFDQLEELGLISGRRPRFVAVQMAGCAPIVRAFERGDDVAETWAEPNTRVWGLRVPKAIGDFIILSALRDTDGLAISVKEDEVGPIAERIACEEGMLIGPEGAACLVALERLIASKIIAPGDRVVVFQTGHPANY